MWNTDAAIPIIVTDPAKARLMSTRPSMRLDARFIHIAIAFVVLSVIFFVIERAFGRSRGRPLLRLGWFTDTCFWFFTPLVTKLLTRLSLIIPAAILIALGLVTAQGLKMGAYHGFGPVARQPIWLQAVEIFVLVDLFSYWSHRLFHRGRWWPFHAVHHSSEDLDWLSSVRLHPVNDLVTKLAQVTPLLLVGFNPFVSLSVSPLLTLYAIFIHANVDWDFGPLRYIIATPAFHRWHHSKDREAWDKNFAGLFPFWDILFGTFYMPKDRPPQNFGIPGSLPEEFRRSAGASVRAGVGEALTSWEVFRAPPCHPRR